MVETTPKTVHITNYYHKDSGGISTAYNHLLDAANLHARFVTLIVPGEEDETVQVGKFGRIYFIKANIFPFFDKRYRVILPQLYMPTGSRIREILLEEKPDLIEVCDKYTISWLAGMVRIGKFKQLGRPVLVHMSCERMDDNVRAFLTKHPAGRWLARSMMKNLIYPMFDFYAANSKYTLSEIPDSMGDACCQMELGKISQRLWRFFRGSTSSLFERSYVHEAGVDTLMFHPHRRSNYRSNKLREKLNLEPNEKIVLYAGRISPEKNIEILPEIISLLNSISEDRFVLVIAGDGPQREWLESRLETAANGMYRFCGHITVKEDLADLYANSDVFLHPNPKEPFGIGPLEAMASGTPVVVPNAGGVLSYCDTENSWLVDGNSSHFAAAVLSVFKYPLTTAAKVRRGQYTAHAHTWKQSTDRIFANYDQMISTFTASSEHIK